MPDKPIKVSVFLSWSGYQSISYETAKILQKFLPDILQGLEVYFSKTDIGAGATWFTDLNEHLLTADFAVFCLTQQNLHSQWMHYEAGAVMMHENRTCPFLFCVDKKNLDSPLSYHQCVEFQRNSDKANKESFKSLLNRLNEICRDKGVGISDERLKRQFNRIYNRDIKRAFSRLSKRAKEADNLDAQTPTDSDEIHATLKRLEEQNASLHTQLQTMSQSMSQTLFSSANSTNETDENTANSPPDTPEIIMAMPLSVSLWFLEYCINVLSAFPPAILERRSAKKKGKDGNPLTDKDGNPLMDKGRWEVIDQGKDLINVMRSEENGDKRQCVESFQALVKEKLSIPSPHDDEVHENKVYGSPVSMKTVREALDAVICNILLYLKRKRRIPNDETRAGAGSGLPADAFRHGLYEGAERPGNDLGRF